MKKAFLCCLLIWGIQGCSTVTNIDRANIALSQLNKAYQFRDADAFMTLVSPNYESNLEDLKTAVENDMVGFESILYATTVIDVQYDEQTKLYTAFIHYNREIRSPRFGIEHANGDVALTFELDKKGHFILRKMPYPTIYGLITP